MHLPHSPFDSIEDAVAAIAAGHPVVVTDDESRENEGDLVAAASLATPETVNMMIRWARGLICVPMHDREIRRLGLSPMVQHNRESMGTAFTVSVDAAQGITTGISAYERTTTIRVLADPRSSPSDLVQPGHVFPLRAHPGGVLARAGHTEAAVDLALLAGLSPVAVICEILNDDGSCARLPELIEFKRVHGLRLISIASLIEYRHLREQLVERVALQPLETAYGTFDLHVFRSQVDGAFHFALTLGDLGSHPVLVRVHSANLLADVFQTGASGHPAVFPKALQLIAEAGSGVALYMTQPCGGLKIPGDRAPGAQGCQPVTGLGMDFRAYGIGAQILAALGLRQIRLLTSSSRKVVALQGYGLEIVEQLPLT